MPELTRRHAIAVRTLNLLHGHYGRSRRKVNSHTRGVLLLHRHCRLSRVSRDTPTACCCQTLLGFRNDHTTLLCGHAGVAAAPKTPPALKPPSRIASNSDTAPCLLRGQAPLAEIAHQHQVAQTERETNKGRVRKSSEESSRTDGQTERATRSAVGREGRGTEQHHPS